VQYCADLTAQARAGKIDPVVGRDAEIARLIEILARRRKNNAVIVGEPGVGKTALVEGLALAIVSGAVPEHLKDRRILALDLAAMVAGAKFKGEFEERFKKLLSELEAQSDTAILFVDEIHSLLSAGAGGGGMDAANILKPALARGEIRVVGATTVSEFRRHIEKDTAFARRFVRIDVAEPDEPTCLAILNGLKPGYEKHHRVSITDAALTAAVKLSRRYVPDRFLPDKAVDLVDEAAADVRILGETIRLAFEAGPQGAEAPPAALDALAKALAGRGYDVPQASDAADRPAALRSASDGLGREVGEREVARRISLATGIPVHRMLSSERERLSRLEDHLHQRIIGQQAAVREVAEAVRRARAGLKRPTQPVGTFLFLGPTGTGKTELAKALAEFLFDDEKAMVRIDMSEYQQDFSIQRLIGAPPGFVGYEEGGALTEAVRRRPYAVILFDEIEKAHPRCFDILLQVMDDGRLTDGQSRTVDFSNAVIILTSNFAGPWIASKVEAGEPVDPAELREMMLRDGKFRPEFLNRFTSFVVFEPLSQEQVARIVDLQVKALEKLLQDRQVALQLSPAARAWLAERGYDPAMGARPVKRLIDQKIANALAMRLIQDEKAAGKTARVELVEGDLRIALV
jgi:ATP-dependent Clp protease ATP-binding subunit ClpC